MLIILVFYIVIPGNKFFFVADYVFTLKLISNLIILIKRQIVSNMFILLLLKNGSN